MNSKARVYVQIVIIIFIAITFHGLISLLAPSIVASLLSGIVAGVLFYLIGKEVFF